MDYREGSACARAWNVLSYAGETRLTFASWGLATGESPEWVARTIGHANTAMI
jgi:hypothetical protein